MASAINHAIHVDVIKRLTGGALHNVEESLEAEEEHVTVCRMQVPMNSRGRATNLGTRIDRSLRSRGGRNFRVRNNG